MQGSEWNWKFVLDTGGGGGLYTQPDRLVFALQHLMMLNHVLKVSTDNRHCVNS